MWSEEPVSLRMMDTNAPLHKIIRFFSGSEHVVQDYHERIINFPTPPNSVYSCSSTLHNVSSHGFFPWTSLLTRQASKEEPAFWWFTDVASWMTPASYLVHPYLKTHFPFLAHSKQRKRCVTETKFTYTLPSRSLTSPLKSYRPNRKAVCQPSFFRGVANSFQCCFFSPAGAACLKNSMCFIEGWVYGPQMIGGTLGNWT